MKLKLITLLILITSLSFSQTGVIRDNLVGTVGDGLINGVGNSFSTPVPKTNLLGYWSASRDGIKTGDTIILKSVTGAVTGKIKITGRDWTDRYVPLKTAATLQWVGTPTNDPNFWTPAIYPTTVFSDVDYNHKTFFQVKAHTINSDSTELLPARITEIAVYSTAVSGADLTTCNTYFGVPALVGGANWVDPVNGVDATGDGTLAKPYKTLAKIAPLALANGTTVYVKSGSETFSSYLDMGDAYNSKHYIAIGRYEATSNGGTFVFRIEDTNNWLKGFIINGTAQQIPLSLEYEGNGSTIENCVIKGLTAGATCVRINYGNTTLKDCVFSGTPLSIINGATTSKSMLITGCYSNSAVPFIIPSGGATNTYNVQFCKLINTSIAYIRYSDSYNLVGNYIKGLVNTAYNGAFTGSFRMFHNEIHAGASGLQTGFNPVGTVAMDYFWNIQYNTFYSGAYHTLPIGLVDQARVKIFHNISDSRGSDQAAGFVFSDARSTRTCIDSIGYNYILGDNVIQNQYQLGVIELGNQDVAVGDNKLQGSRIYGNYINLGNATAASHGIVTFKNIGVDTWYNFIRGSGIGICYKDLSTINANAKSHHNVVIDCQDGYVIKGFSGVKVYNNTIINTYSNTLGSGIDVFPNPTTNTESNNDTIKNNIFYQSATGSNKDCIKIEPTGTGHVSDYNVFYAPNNHYGMQGITSYTFAQWQALGFDAHSTVSDLGLSTTILYPAIPVNGVNLGATYNLGLDVSTSWPTIVTKQQGATWQIGAYVK